MKRSTQTYSTSYLKMLVDGDKNALDDVSVVEGGVRINGDHFKGEYLNIEGITFIGFVWICNFEKTRLSIDISGSTFLSGLLIENIKNAHFTLMSSRATDVRLIQSKFQGVYLDEVHIDSKLDLSSSDISGNLTLHQLELCELELFNRSSGNMIKATRVITDNMALALQFRMINVPVLVPTEKVREMIANKSPAPSAV